MKMILFCVLLAAPLCAQRDYLNSDEVDKIKEAQEPVERLKLYAQFAKQRVELVQNLMKKEKAGRSIMIHDALDDYTKILDAIDDVTDDALLHSREVALGLAAVASIEKQTLPILQKLQDSQPKDLSRFDFVLRQAIETTQDSLEASQQDAGKRARDAQARDERDKQELKQLGGAPDKAGQPGQGQTEQPPPRKAPTLKRPGEK